MKASQVHDMTIDQLNDELVKLKKEQFNLRFQAASGQLENTARVRQVRRDIARVQTVARERDATATLPGCRLPDPWHPLWKEPHGHVELSCCRRSAS